VDDLLVSKTKIIVPGAQQSLERGSGAFRRDALGMTI
jgi:hypothetical protein